MSDKLNTQDIKALLADIIARFPDTVNPVRPRSEIEQEDGDYVCLYTDPDNRDRHCIVGQLAVELEWGLPALGNTKSAPVVADNLGWPVTQAGAAFLGQVQSRADGVTNEINPGPVPWGTIDLEEIFKDA